MTKYGANPQLKICLVTISYGAGGAERSTALLSKMLFDLGIDVTTVLLTDRIDYKYSGKIFNLGKIKNKKDNFIARLARFKKLRTFLKQEKFDLIIDNRTKSQWRKEWFYLDYLYRGQRLIYVMRSFKKENYLTNHEVTTQKIIDRTERIVSVSKEIAEVMNKEYNTNRFVPIYNPIEKLVIRKPEEQLNFPSDYVLFLGRLDVYVKNLPLLLEAYSQSILPKSGIDLVLIGESEAEGDVFIKKYAIELGISNKIHYLPFTSHVGWYIQQARYLVLTSRYEGFPRVLIESLSVGTPVVSVDCQSGPKEVIIQGKNGLLVPNFDVKALAQAMSRMYSDKELYCQCKKNTKESVVHLTMENISKQWEKLINEVLDNSNRTK